MVSENTEIMQYLSSNRCKNEVMAGTTIKQSGTTGKEAHPGCQTKRISISFMNSSLYKAAAEGEFNSLKQQAEHLDLQLLLTPNKNTVLHINITSQSGIAKSSVEFVQEILCMCPLLLLQANIKNESPLHIAARHGDVAVVGLLIQTAKEDRHMKLEPRSALESVRQMLRMTNERNDTALHEAVRNNHLDVAQRLIKEDPDYSYPANLAGETPLYLAAERGYRQLVFEILRSCTSPSYDGPIGRTALHAAVICNDEEMTREILVHDVKRILTKEADEGGWVPLHYAAFHGHLSILKLLLDFDKSAAYIAEEKENRTALHVSASQRHIGIMKELLSRCPDCCELLDHRGKAALQFAMESRHPEAVNDSILNYLLNEQAARGHSSDLHIFSGDLHRRPTVDLVDDVQDWSAADFNVANPKVMAREKSYTRTSKNLSVSQTPRDPPKHREEAELRENNDLKSMEDKCFEETKDAHLLVSILIATVTFAAGMTIPGGFVNDTGHDQGSAILAKTKAFKAFVVTDVIAMAVSSYAVFVHIFRSLHQSDLPFQFPQTWLATFSSILSMLVAFITGTYSVLQLSPGLATANTILGCLFVITFYIFNIFSIMRGCIYFCGGID